MTPQSPPPSPEKLSAPSRSGMIRRILMGGRLNDFGRLQRYVVFGVLGSAVIWGAIAGYLKTAPVSYKSQTSLILPGSGVSASMNLSGIGQASSFASSAFASNSVSPTETYKRLIAADRILGAAAASLGITQGQLGKPRIVLVDQTSLIHFELTGSSPKEAQARGDAILAAFFVELDALRADEQQTREDSGLSAIADYRNSVAATRRHITQLQQETGLLTISQYDSLLADQTILEAKVRALKAACKKSIAMVAAFEKSLGLDARGAALTLKLFADNEYLALMDQVALQSAGFAEASSHYGNRHPKVLKAQRSQDQALMAAQRRAVVVTGLSPQSITGLDLAPSGARADLLKQMVEAETERRGMDGHLAALATQLEGETTRLQALAPAAARFQDLQRDFVVAEAVFASGIARAQSTKSDIYSSYPLVQVLENPSLPEMPSSPNRTLAIAAGVVASLMLLVGLVLGWVRLALIERLLSRPVASV